MEFKVKEIDIPSSNPFLNDKLDRKGEVDNLTYLLKNISSPIVLSINAPWGCGKSVFIKMLHNNLINNGANSIYFNAWETDFAKDPLLAFLGEMNNALDVYLKGDKLKRKAWEKAKKAGLYLVKKGIPVLVKAGTAGMIDTEAIINEDIPKLMKGFSEDILKEYTKNKDSISLFKENIKRVLINKEGNVDKLFIFIDELDRCRPTYAIELLERIKHILNIKGIVFVLALDKEQLSHSVKSLYGYDFEAIGYLRRFFDIEYRLATPNLDSFITYNFEYFNFKQFFEKRSKYLELRDDDSYLLETFSFLASHKKMTLREVEQLFSKLNLVILSTRENSYLYPVLLVFLLFVKEYHPSSYLDYINESNTPKEIIEYLYTLIKKEERCRSLVVSSIEALLIAGKMTQDKKNIGNSIQIHKQIIDDANSDIEEKEYSKKVFDLYHNNSNFRIRINLPSLIKRIEMLDHFIFDEVKS